MCYILIACQYSWPPDLMLLVGTTTVNKILMLTVIQRYYKHNSQLSTTNGPIAPASPPLVYTVLLRLHVAAVSYTRFS